MNFYITKEVFDLLPDFCVGVAVAKGIDNAKDYPDISKMLDEAAGAAHEKFQGKKVKEAPEIVPYREAFRRAGINPNKFRCSIEALFTRIAKGGTMPHINPLVDLNNAVSLKHALPMGTHDLGISEEDIVIRLAREGDVFLPFGADKTEAPDEGEIIYAVGNEVRTRRWTWRQSEQGKITDETDYVFFPIDGFAGVNDREVKEAVSELAEILKSIFGCEVKTGFVDKENPSMDLSL